MTDNNNNNDSNMHAARPLRTSAIDRQRMQELVLQSAAALQYLHRMLLETVDELDDHLTISSQYACLWLQKLLYAEQKHAQGNRAWQQFAYGELYHIDVSDVCQGLIRGVTQRVKLSWYTPFVTQAAPDFLRNMVAYLPKWFAMHFNCTPAYFLKCTRELLQDVLPLSFVRCCTGPYDWHVIFEYWCYAFRREGQALQICMRVARPNNKSHLLFCETI